MVQLCCLSRVALGLQRPQLCSYVSPNIRPFTDCKLLSPCFPSDLAPCRSTPCLPWTYIFIDICCQYYWDDLIQWQRQRQRHSFCESVKKYMLT